MATSEYSPLLGNSRETNMDSDNNSALATNSSTSISSDFDLPRSEESYEHLPSTVNIESTEPLKDAKKSTKSKRRRFPKIDETAFQFALRMAILLTLSTLFVLIKKDGKGFPDGMWVLVSVLFVSWFPQLDAASVIEKIIQRLMGTFLGAFLGLSCGFVSLVITKVYVVQACFLAFCVFVFNFGIIFLAGQCKLGEVKVIKRFNYATILCVLTFCICIMPFSQNEDPKWGRASYRVLNVVIGCALGALGSIVIVPKSTTDVLYTKASRQVVMAGEAAEAILKVSSEYFAGRVEVSKLSEELLKTPLESSLRLKFSRSNSMCSGRSVEAGATDVALKKYEDAIADWRVSKMLFPLTKYDPFKIKLPDNNNNSDDDDEDGQDPFHTEIARTLARCLRIQTTIVVLDGMVRSDAEFNFTPHQLDSLYKTGRLIRHMLQLPLDEERSRPAALSLLGRLEEVRASIATVSAAVADVEDHHDPNRVDGMRKLEQDLLSTNGDGSRSGNPMNENEDEKGRGIPTNATGSNENTLFFLQLVDHLILRSMRLYQAWKHVEYIRKQNEEKEYGDK